MQQIKGMTTLLTIVAILGWFALAGQFYLIIQNSVTSIAEAL